jgi:MerR family transcriptional regulator, light-induced transcriptional regulator
MMYPIEAVARRCGVNAATLRAWERRHDAIRPERTETGRRLYSEAMLVRTELLRTLLDHGFRIGEIASWSDDELRKAAADWQTRGSRPDATREPRDTVRGTMHDVIGEAVGAVERLDRKALIATLDRAAARVGRLALIDDVIFPVIKASAQSDSHGTGHTHPELRTRFLTTTIRTFLSSLFASAAERSGLPTVAIATPAGHTSEIGALGAALHVHAAELEPIYLGAELPAADIAHGARTLGARAVVLALDAAAANPTATVAECTRVRDSLPRSIPVYFGGRIPEAVIAELSEAGLRHAATMDDLRNALAHDG